MDQCSRQISFDEFDKVDIRVGRILEAKEFPKARKPSYRLSIDFGPQIGIKQSSAQLTLDYTTDDLVGRQCLAVVNLPPRRIAGFASEVLVLGVPRAGEGSLSLVVPEAEAVPGGRLY